MDPIEQHSNELNGFILKFRRHCQFKIDAVEAHNGLDVEFELVIWYLSYQVLILVQNE